MLKIVPSVLTTIIGFLGGYQLQRVKVRHEIRQQHLNDIKSRVLEPIKNLITHYYIPILNYKKSNLTVTITPINKRPNLLRPEEWELCYQIVIKEPRINEGRENFVYQSVPVPEIDQHLSADAKRFHFPHIMNRFEAVQQEFQNYNNRCLDYAKALRKKIVAGSNLPDHFRGSFLLGTGIIADKLTIIIFEQILGIGGFPNIRIEPSGVLRAFSEIIAQGTDDEMKHVMGLIDSLVKEADKNKEPFNVALPLLEKFNELKEDVEKLLLVHKLPGKCSYSKI